MPRKIIVWICHGQAKPDTESLGSDSDLGQGNELGAGAGGGLGGRRIGRGLGEGGVGRGRRRLLGALGGCSAEGRSLGGAHVGLGDGGVRARPFQLADELGGELGEGGEDDKGST